jgi:hypothetical protein
MMEDPEPDLYLIITFSGPGGPKTYRSGSTTPAEGI